MKVEMVERPAPSAGAKGGGGGQPPKYNFQKLMVGGKAMECRELADDSEVKRIRSALGQFKLRCAKAGDPREFHTATEPGKGGTITLVIWRTA